MTTIALSENTAELLNCKKNLDECFAKLSKVQDNLFGFDKAFEDSLDNAYIAMNDVIMHLLSEQIDTNSTESNYKVI